MVVSENSTPLNEPSSHNGSPLIKALKPSEKVLRITSSVAPLTASKIPFGNLETTNLTGSLDCILKRLRSSLGLSISSGSK